MVGQEGTVYQAAAKRLPWALPYFTMVIRGHGAKVKVITCMIPFIVLYGELCPLPQGWYV